MLYPFLRHGLDILFVGLNPANTSSKKGHYFSTYSSFWDQLFMSGLITRHVDKDVADEQVFGSSRFNANGWEYGITDLVNYFVESDSRKVMPSNQNCIDLKQTIFNYKPKVVVLLHYKVKECFVEDFLGKRNVKLGNLGKLIKGCDTVFFNVPFPHGSRYSTVTILELYRQVKETLESWDTMSDT